MLKNFLQKWLHIPHREDNVFSIVFFIAFIVPLLFIPIFPEGYETVKYSALLVLTGIGTIVLISRKQVFVHKPTLVFIAALLVLNVLSATYSLDVINSVIGLYGRYTGSVFFMVSWAMLLLLVWNAVGRDESRRLTLLRVLVFDALLVSILGITQYFDIAYYGGVDRGVRPIIPSFIGNQNFYAMFLVAVFPAIIVLWNQAKARTAQYYYAVTAVTSLWALILSGSRGSMVGFAVMGAVFLFVVLLRRYPKQLWIGAIGSFALAGALYAGFFALTRSDYVNGVSSNAQYTEQTRYVIWGDSLRLIAQSPWVGTGSGNFFIAFERLGNVALSGNERFDDAHNLVLHLAVTLGLPGLAVFLIITGLAAALAWRESGQLKLSAVWVIAALAGVLAAASFNPVSIPIWMVLGFGIAFGSSYLSVQREINFPYRTTGFLLGGAVLLFGTCFIISETLGVYGLRAYRQHDNSKAEQYFKPAVLFNPFNTTAQIYLAGSRINQNKDLKQRAIDIDKILSQHPRSSGTCKAAADLTYKLYFGSGDEYYKQRMNELYEKSIELEPNSSNLYGSAAYAFYKTGQPDKAMEYLDRQLALPDNKDYPYSWILRSKIYLERGQKDQGLLALETAYSKMTGQILLKYFLKEIRESGDVSKLNFPVAFPEVDI